MKDNSNHIIIHEKRCARLDEWSGLGGGRRAEITFIALISAEQSLKLIPAITKRTLIADTGVIGSECSAKVPAARNISQGCTVILDIYLIY